MEPPLIKPRGESRMISNAPGPSFDLGELVDPTLTPIQQLGKRLFLETRFSNYFARNCGDDVNKPLATGEPILATVTTRGGQSVRGPFSDRSINCRSCHFVEELFGTRGGGTRVYTDFAARSAVPDRGDGLRTTARNARSMVDSVIPRKGATFLHADGEFTSNQSVVRATITGRNLGWLPTETAQAIAHIARVVREDSGQGRLGALFGGSYRKVFGADDVPALFLLPTENRLDLAAASDEQVFNAVVTAIAAYLDSLTFMRDSEGAHNGSPYDLFLAKNGLPRAPNPGETDEQYTQRLRQMVEQLREPKWVVPTDGFFRFHNQFFQFGPTELEGLRIFLRSEAPQARSNVGVRALLLTVLPIAVLAVVAGATDRRRRLLSYLGIAALLSFALIALTWSRTGSVAAQSVSKGVGNCAGCHTPPNFTDYAFHNTGASQEEYDAVNGSGAFARLRIPMAAEREADWSRYLPATPQHPLATSAFRSQPRAGSPTLADLGMWNVFANADFPEPQQPMQELLCGSTGNCSRDEALRRSVARFRTPPLRDLGHSDPYLHNGSKASIADVLTFYIRMSQLAREGKVRNGDTLLKGINLSEDDAKALVAFLESLNEDYE
jgi:cytochrome c peroxidase